MTHEAERVLLASCDSRSVVARAPGRVNIIGEHTDYNGGFVMPMAIEQGVTAAVGERMDGQVIVRSLQVPDEPVVVPSFEALKPGTARGWAAYAMGAAWALHEATGRGGAVEIVIDGDVPLGAGLSSSAAVECAVITALNGLWGSGLAARELARLAQRAENEFVGVPTGAMDQVASMLGEEGSALFFDVREDRIEMHALHEITRRHEFLVIDTRASHALVDGGYASRRRQCEQAAQALGVASLREVTDLDAAVRALNGTADEQVVTRRMRHVVTENARVLEAREALDAGNAVGLGRLMSASHASLRDDFEVSCVELDLAVDSAMTAGAIGARMTGGGFGGSALALVPAGQAAAVASAVDQAFRAAGYLAPRTWQVQPAAGARLLGST